MSDFNPYQPPAQPVAPGAPAAPIALDGGGLGGWLILVGLGIVLTPFRMLLEMGKMYKSVITDGAWGILTTPGSDQYHALWAPFLIAESGINLVMVAVWLYLIYLFFARKRALPRWYVFAHCVTLVILILDALAMQLVQPDQPVFDPDTTKEIVRTLVVVCIWVPYMLVSKRVAATFVH